MQQWEQKEQTKTGIVLSFSAVHFSQVVSPSPHTHPTPNHCITPLLTRVQHSNADSFLHIAMSHGPRICVPSVAMDATLQDLGLEIRRLQWTNHKRMVRRSQIIVGLSDNTAKTAFCIGLLADYDFRASV